MYFTNSIIVVTGLAITLGIAHTAEAAILNLDFNSGLNNASGGDLIFSGTDGFQVTFTDDNSNGSFGSDGTGVHITNIGFGNKKAGHQSDFVLGTFNTFANSGNFHSSGIVATFNQGVESVSFVDTDDDGTTKTLFAFDEFGTLIYQSSPGTQIPFFVDTILTSNHALIHSIEFDTQAGIAGGSFDNTYFTIDNFQVKYSTDVPEPTTVSSVLWVMGLLGFLFRKQHQK